MLSSIQSNKSLVFFNKLKSRTKASSLTVEKSSLQQLTTEMHRDCLLPWIDSLKNGTLTGKQFSPRTINLYKPCIETYFKTYSVISFEGLISCLGKMKTYSQRKHFYQAMVCFSKYLIRHSLLTKQILSDLKEVEPKRTQTPKRKVVTEVQLEQLYQCCDCQQDKVLLELLAHTGIRASEAASLNWQDIDLDRGILSVHHGKGGKSRRLGLNKNLIESLYSFRDPGATPIEPVLTNKYGERIDRYGINHRLQKLSRKAGVLVSPHALRRAFVTINAHKNRPLALLKEACGHSDIKTTMAYCMTTEHEVINKMQDWD